MTTLVCLLIALLLVGYVHLYQQLRLLWEVANALDVSLTQTRHDLSWEIHEKTASRP